MAGDALPGSVARAWLDHKPPSRSVMTIPHRTAVQWHGRYEAGENDAGVSARGIDATVALCLSARPLSGVGSVTTP